MSNRREGGRRMRLRRESRARDIKSDVSKIKSRLEDKVERRVYDVYHCMVYEIHQEVCLVIIGAESRRVVLLVYCMVYDKEFTAACSSAHSK